MIKKIKVEVQEEKGKKAFKDVVEAKAGALAQEKMVELKNELKRVLSKYGLVKDEGGDEE